MGTPHRELGVRRRGFVALALLVGALVLGLVTMHIMTPHGPEGMPAESSVATVDHSEAGEPGTSAAVDCPACAEVGAGIVAACVLILIVGLLALRPRGHGCLRLGFRGGFRRFGA